VEREVAVSFDSAVIGSSELVRGDWPAVGEARTGIAAQVTARVDQEVLLSGLVDDVEASDGRVTARYLHYELSEEFPMEHGRVHF